MCAARARGDRPAAAPEPGRDDARRARGAAGGHGLAGDHARDGRRPARRERGGPHFGSPDKLPGARGWRRSGSPASCAIPFTTGILIGIGETREERIEALLAIRDAARAARPHPGGDRPELPREAGHADGRRIRSRRSTSCSGRSPSARLVLGPRRARPGAAEPRLRRLPAPARRRDRRLGRRLAGDDRPRQPRGAVAGDRAAREATARRAGSSSRRGCPSTPSTLDRALGRPGASLPHVRCAPPTRVGLAREDALGAGRAGRRSRSSSAATRCRSTRGDELGEDELVRLFRARGEERAARLRRRRPAAPRGVRRRGHATSSRATSSTRTSATSAAASAPSRRGSSPRTCAAPPYLVPHRGDRPPRAGGLGARRDRGLPPGRHPPGVHGRLLRSRSCEAIKARAARTCTCTPSRRSRSGRARRRSALPLDEYLARLRDVGLGSLPGTAAEILDDEVRARHLPGQGDDRRSGSRCTTPRTGVGLRSNATIMFGHVDAPRSWARHLLRVREQQQRDAAASPSSCRCRSCTWRRRCTCKGRARRGPDVPRGAAHARGRAARAASRGSRTSRPRG